MAAEKVGLSIAGKIIELLFEPIQRELGYLLCFNNNIRDLQTGLRELEATRNDVQGREDAEQRSRKTLGEAVKLWIVDANGKITEAEKVIEDKAELQKGCFSIKWCPNLKLRFSLGRKGKKLSLVLKELLQSGKDHLLLTGIALPMPPINMRDYTGDASDFESRKKIMEEIIEMLMDKETRLIGICGMGGIGKTTLAKQVLQKVHDFHNNLFEFQVISTVSRPPNFNAIQQQVIEMLGGSLKEIDNETLRAEHLRRAFDKKKVVVLLDDVWEEFDLNAKGFPLRESDCCKIIYTSRIQGLWSGERRTITKKEISVDLLSSEEALNLFRRKAYPRDDEDDNDFHSKYEIARKIVEECKGLPLALEVAGGALIEKDTYHWEDMLFKLQSLGDEKVHKVLETSYSYLEDPIAKNIFLLCCLFPEDERIPIETLYRYAMGLQLFKGTMNDLYHIRNRVYTLVDDLITRNLLINVQDYGDGRVVKMHDVVRDVGLSIAKQEEKDIHFRICDQGVNQLQNYVAPNTKMISILFLKSGLKVPDDVMEFRGSKLELLRLQRSFGSNIEISWNLFQGADDLKVLDIFGRYVISEFPYSSPFPYLAKLKMLSLEYMDLNITSKVSFIKHLTCLETLSFRWSEMKTLPNEVGELRNLKVLDLTNCSCFIKDGILSRLTNLQELYMWGSFYDWKNTLKEKVILSTIGEDNNNAAKLIELSCLDKLRRLELIVLNIEQVPRNVRLFSSSTLLKQFKISIGTRGYEDKFESSERSQLRVDGKNVEDGVNLFHALGVLIKNGITSLYLHNHSNMWEQMSLNRHLSAMKEDVEKIDFNTLETLELCEMGQLTCFCKGVNEIYFDRLRNLKLKELKSFIFSTKIKIPQLKHLEISSLPSIITLCNIETPSLQILEINSCDNLKYIFFSDSFTVKNIFNLQSLAIRNCRTLKGVIKILPDTEEQQQISIKFSNLMKLELWSLDNLASFVIHANHLGDEEENEEKSQNALFCCDEISFSCLEELTIYNLSKINYIVARKGQGLRRHHRNIEEGYDRTFEPQFFPNLSKLRLFCLDQLVSFVVVKNYINDKSERQNVLFYHDDQVSFPCLNVLKISGLPKINYIVGCLEVRYMSNLIHMYQSNHSEGGVLLFQNVRELNIGHCEKLRYLFSENICRVAFNYLEKLSIFNCPTMELVMENEKELEAVDDKTLETLKLCQMNQLTCFCKGINEICFDRLRSLKLEGLESFIFPNKIEIPQLKYLKIISIQSIITLCNILAPSLQELKIDDCDNLKYICFSNSLMVKNIFHLGKLTITRCERLKGVIYIEEQRQISIKFSNLMILELGCLDKLASFVIHINNLGVEEENEDKPQNALFYCDEDEVSLPCLQKLRLRELSKINYIIGWKGRQCHHRDIEEGCDKEILQPFFPNLKSLTLGYFCQLVSFVGFINPMGDNSEKQNTLFYPDDDEVSFSCLEELRIEHLSKIKYIVARKGQGGRRHHRNIEEDCDEKIQPQFFPNLLTLGLFGLYQLVSFVAVKNNIDDESEKQNALFYEDDEVSFSCLKELRIEHLSKIKYIVARKCQGGRRHHHTIEEDCDEKIQPQFFPNLSNLRLFSLYQLVSFVAVKSEKQNALFYEDDEVSFPYFGKFENRTIANDKLFSGVQRKRRR